MEESQYLRCAARLRVPFLCSFSVMVDAAEKHDHRDALCRGELSHLRVDGWREGQYRWYRHKPFLLRPVSDVGLLCAHRLAELISQAHLLEYPRLPDRRQSREFRSFTRRAKLTKVQGRSASAVSCNSFVRGSFGCILSQVAIPIQNAIGDGGLYTIVAGLLALASCGIALLACKPPLSA